MDKIDLRYQRGKIYTIRCYDDDTLIYVGSTIQPLSARMAKHRFSKLCSLYQYVNNNFNGDWKKWYIELYEEYPCNNKQLLEKREGEITRLIGNINKVIPARTKKEHYEDNKEIILEKKKEKYKANKEIILEHKKQYRIDNKEKLAEKNKKRYDANKEKILKIHKKYRDANKEKLAEKKKQNYEANKEIINEKKKEKIICDHCGSEITKGNLSKHQKTKKCIESK